MAVSPHVPIDAFVFIVIPHPHRSLSHHAFTALSPLIDYHLLYGFVPDIIAANFMALHLSWRTIFSLVTHLTVASFIATPVWSAALAAAMATKRGREDDALDERNVRARLDVAEAPVPFISTVPDAPTGPRPIDPAWEFLFGPVKWKSNIHREARTVIAEGMRTRPNMRDFATRRGPNDEHIIASFDTPASTGWFIKKWMEQRKGKWAYVVARPNV
ncbi:hypothetical protein K438DRAFT_1972677 [Mycena galopus ATCC 62051]|nr:hypothetical protein K438DRAFT_1972677 [Mycena galopus ATCC 62051]